MKTWSGEDKGTAERVKRKFTVVDIVRKNKCVRKQCVAFYERYLYEPTRTSRQRTSVPCVTPSPADWKMGYPNNQLLDIAAPVLYESVSVYGQ